MMQQIAIVGLIASNIVLGAIALWPAEPKKPNWQTLIIYRDDNYSQVALEWRSGAITQKEAELLPFMPKMHVLETFTTPGGPVDAEWARSVHYAAPK